MEKKRLVILIILFLIGILGCMFFWVRRPMRAVGPSIHPYNGTQNNGWND